MSTVDEIQAAIDKLTVQKASSTAGPWSAWHPSTDAYYGNSSVDAPTDDPDNPYMVVEGGERADVDLIVTLHATIDAQLAILLAATDYYRAGTAFLTQADPFIEHGLTLARSINGATHAPR